MITKSTIPTHAWSEKKGSIDIDIRQFSNKSIAVLAGVSEQIGTDLVMLFDSSVTINKFKVFLEELRRKYFYDDLCIFMDRLSVHVSKRTIERMDDLGIAYIFNSIYSPQFNGVEEYFSIAKKVVKDRRLDSIINNKEFDMKLMVKDSFESVNVLKIKNCI